MRPTWLTAACLFSLLWGPADATASGRAARGRGPCPCPTAGVDHGAAGLNASPFLPFRATASLRPTTPPAPALPVVHAVLIMDTNAAYIGTSVQQDLTNLQNLLRVLGSACPNPVTLSGANVNRAKIISTLSDLSLSVSSQDTVLCYYSGHGIFKAGQHVFPLSSGEDVSRSEVLQLIRATPARLKILLTDACASLVAARTGLRLYTRVSPLPVLEALLFHHQGEVNINACEMKERAGCDDTIGGYFTASFCAECTSPHPASPPITWASFFAAVANRTSVTALPLIQNPLPMTALSAVHPTSAPAAGPAPAVLSVRLPADATVTLNDEATRSDGPWRVFVSPPLDHDRVYYYDLTAARMTADGRQVVTIKVAVVAGRVATVPLDGPWITADRE